MKPLLILLTCLLFGNLLFSQKTETSTHPLTYKLTIYVYDKDSKSPIADAEIKLTSTNNDEWVMKTNHEGAVVFEEENGQRIIKRDVSYAIEISASNYLVGKDQITTVGLEKSIHFVKEFFLQNGGGCGPFIVPCISFEKNATTYVPDTLHNMDLFETILIENPTILLELLGCSNPDEKDRQKLERNRAEAVRNDLIKRGINPDRLIVNSESSFDRDRLTQREELKINAKVDFRVLSFDYKPKK